MSRAATSQKAVTGCSKNDAPLLGVFDGGNHGSVTYFGAVGESPVVRSLFTRLPSGMSARRCSQTSPILGIDEGRYHVGIESQFYDGASAVATGDKTNYAKPMFLASVPPEVSGKDVILVSLYHSLNPEKVLKIQRSLEGEHHWTRNGIAMSVDVKAVEVHLEGAGAWHEIHPEGKADSWSLVIDIGGSTWAASVCDVNGVVEDQTSSVQGGTLALCRKISQDTRLTKPLSSRGVSRPELSDIMTGLEDGHCYVGDPGLSWEAWLDDYRIPWWNGIRDSALAQFQHHRKRINEVIVTGGGAHLVRDFLKDVGGVHIPKRPELAATVGTWRSVNRRLSDG